MGDKMLPVPHVTIQYVIEYLIPSSELKHPGDFIPDQWGPWARGYTQEAVVAALEELREASPSFRWRAVRHELVEQVMDW